MKRASNIKTEPKTSAVSCSSDRAEIFKKLGYSRNLNSFRNLMKPTTLSLSSNSSKRSTKNPTIESSSSKKSSYVCKDNNLLQKIEATAKKKQLKTKISRKRKKKKSKKKQISSRISNNLNKEVPLSLALQDIVDCPTMTRSETIKAIWAYAKAEGRVDPKDGRIIVCDEKLKRIFNNQERVHMFEVQSLLLPHFLYNSKKNTNNSTSESFILSGQNIPDISKDEQHQSLNASSELSDLNIFSNPVTNHTQFESSQLIDPIHQNEKEDNLSHINYWKPLNNTKYENFELKYKNELTNSFSTNLLDNQILVEESSILDAFIEGSSDNLFNNLNIPKSENFRDLRNISFIPFMCEISSLSFKYYYPKLSLSLSDISNTSVRINFVIDVSTNLIKAFNKSSIEFSISIQKKLSNTDQDLSYLNVKSQDLNETSHNAYIQIQTNPTEKINLIHGYVDYKNLDSSMSYTFTLTINRLKHGITEKSLDLGLIDLMQRKDIHQWSVEAVCLLMQSLNIPNFVNTCREYAINGRSLLKMSISDFKALGLTIGFLIERIQSALVRFN